MNPIKEYLDIGIFLALLIGIGWFAHSQRVDQRNADIAATRQAEIKEAAHVAKVNADAAGTVGDLQARLAGALAAPVEPSVVVRVCRYFPTTNTDAVPAGSGSGSGNDASSGPSSGVGAGGPGVDIAPPTETILKRDKALIDYLQGYIRTCQTTGGCAKASSPVR